MEAAFMSDFDIAIAGGGPAGAAASIHAARNGARVLMVDASSFPRQKVCGEFVSAEARSLLAGLLTDSTALSGTQISRARLFVRGRPLQFAIDPPALSIPRYDLDLALWRTAQAAGAKTMEKVTVQQVESISTSGAFALDTSAGRFTAKLIIDATGRWSKLRVQRRSPGRPRWLGIKAHFELLAASAPLPAPSTDLYFFPGGYCGVQPVAETTVNVCSMVRADTAKDFESLFLRHGDLLERSRGWRQVSSTITTSPLDFHEPTPVEDGILRAGDAAAFIDPFVGDGISLALHSGRLAAQSCLEALKSAGPVAEAAKDYAERYFATAMPAIRQAARLRTLLQLPLLMQLPLLQAMRLPGISRWVVSQTRARVA